MAMRKENPNVPNGTIMAEWDRLELVFSPSCAPSSAAGASPFDNGKLNEDHSSPGGASPSPSSDVSINEDVDHVPTLLKRMADIFSAIMNKGDTTARDRIYARRTRGEESTGFVMYGRVLAPLEWQLLNVDPFVTWSRYWEEEQKKLLAEIDEKVAKIGEDHAKLAELMQDTTQLERYVKDQLKKSAGVMEGVLLERWFGGYDHGGGRVGGRVAGDENGSEESPASSDRGASAPSVRPTHPTTVTPASLVRLLSGHKKSAKQYYVAAFFRSDAAARYDAGLLADREFRETSDLRLWAAADDLLQKRERELGLTCLSEKEARAQIQKIRTFFKTNISRLIRQCEEGVKSFGQKIRDMSSADSNMQTKVMDLLAKQVEKEAKHAAEQANGSLGRVDMNASTDPGKKLRQLLQKTICDADEHEDEDNLNRLRQQCEDGVKGIGRRVRDNDMGGAEGAEETGDEDEEDLRAGEDVVDQHVEETSTESEAEDAGDHVEHRLCPRRCLHTSATWVEQHRSSILTHESFKAASGRQVQMNPQTEVFFLAGYVVLEARLVDHDEWEK